MARCDLGVGVALLVFEPFISFSSFVSSTTTLSKTNDGSSKCFALILHELVSAPCWRSKLVSSREKKRITKLIPHNIAHQYLKIVLAQGHREIDEKSYQDPLPALTIIYESCKYGCKKAATSKQKSVQCNVCPSLMCEVLLRCESHMSTPSV